MERNAEKSLITRRAGSTNYIQPKSVHRWAQQLGLEIPDRRRRFSRVQVQRLSSVLAPHKRVPRVMDHRSSGCSPAEKFPTSASGRQGRGPVTLLSFHFPKPGRVM
jgi:hypothetical protein